MTEHKNNAAERAAKSELRMVEIEFERPVIYVKDVEIGSEIKKAGGLLKRKKKALVWKRGSSRVARSILAVTLLLKTLKSLKILSLRLFTGKE